MKKDKDYNIELLRVVACLMVVCIHVANCYSRAFGQVSTLSYIFSIGVNAISRISVPIFFMISGSFLIDEPVNIKKNNKRVLRMVKSLIFWSLFYGIWNVIYNGKGYNLKNFFEEPVKKHLWFLYAIIGLYVTLPFWQKLFQSMNTALVKYFVLLWGGLLGVNYLLVLLEMEVKYEIPLVGSSCYLGYFLMGYVLRKYKDKIHISKYVCLVFAMFLLFFTAGITAYKSNLLGEHYERYFEYRNVIIGIAAMLIFLAVVKCKTCKVSSDAQIWVEYISRHSFTIYLSHIIFLDIIKNQMDFLAVPAILGVPLFTMMIFIATFIFSYIWDNVVNKSSTFLTKKVPKRG